jgi:hypothetical protein
VRLTGFETSSKYDIVRAVMESRTFSILGVLGPDPEPSDLNPEELAHPLSARKYQVVRFLRKAGLIQMQGTIVSLAGADLSRANLRFADLKGANLEEVNLEGAILMNADLSDANLKLHTRFSSLVFCFAPLKQAAMNRQ